MLTFISCREKLPPASPFQVRNDYIYNSTHVVNLILLKFRMVELRDGTIEIDGVNIRNIGLDVLRRQLALVPQDSTLFLGTLRENL